MYLHRPIVFDLQDLTLYYCKLEFTTYLIILSNFSSSTVVFKKRVQDFSSGPVLSSNVKAKSRIYKGNKVHCCLDSPIDT